MTSIQPELWVENAREADDFYAAAFGATVMHLVGEGDEIIAQLGVGDAAFWIAPASSTMKRLDPRAIDGATSRTLLVVDDPDTVVAQAVRVGAKVQAQPRRSGGGQHVRCGVFEAHCRSC
jgi:PhnB protein